MIDSPRSQNELVLAALLLEALEDDEESTAGEDEAAEEARQEYLEEGSREWEQVRRKL